MAISNSIIFIKYFGVIACSIYLCAKALNYYKFTIMKILSLLFFATLLSASACLLKQVPFAIDVSIIFVLTLAIFYLFDTSIDVSIMLAITSYAINYSFFAVSSVITELIFLMIFRTKVINLALFFIIAIIQLLLIYIVFSLKRFRHGLAFLRSKEYTGVGLLLSGFIIYIIATIRIESINKSYYAILAFGAVVSIFGIISWWHNRLTKLYIEKNTQRKVNDLMGMLNEKEDKIKSLSDENERLSSLIHRDNKIIPAMGMAVRQYIDKMNHGLPNGSSYDGEAILQQLDDVMQDRYQAVIKAKNLSKIIPDVHVNSINDILQYMYLRASQHDIDYDVIVMCSVKYMVEHVLTELELSTILSDLLENAIVATSTCDYKKILIALAIRNSCYELEIQDSGVPFPKYIFERIGLQRATSHPDSGGSGIGLMTLFEILKKYRASLIIREFSHKQDSISKSITVCFNGKCEFCVQSYRANELKNEIIREGLKILPDSLPSC